MKGKKVKVVPVDSMESREGKRGYRSTYYENWLYTIINGHHTHATLTMGKKRNTQWVGMRAKFERYGDDKNLLPVPK